MTLNDIDLPPIILQQLFTYSLNDVKSEKVSGDRAARNVFFTLGHNQKRITIIVENDADLYLPEDELNFLIGILGACNLTLEDVAIINNNRNTDVNYKTISEQLKAEKIFLFGLNPAQIALPLDFPYYQIQQYNNQTYLTAPKLSHFQNNKIEKTKLWNCLKQIFSI